MNVSMNKLASTRLNSARLFATAATKSKSDLRSGQSKPLYRQTKLANGLNIIAIENNSPISRVGVFVRAGPRFELPGQLGASHALRAAAGLSTQKSTHFGITRNIDYLGGSFTVSSTREDIIYVVDCLRDNIDAPLKYLGDTVTRPVFKPWELDDNAVRMKIDRKRMKESPDVRIFELLHSAAFRGGLSHSLFSPGYMIGKHDHSFLTDYVQTNFVPSRMAVVGSGIELEHLVKGVEKSFAFNSGVGSEVPKSKFIANTIRKQTSLPVSLVAVASEGVGANNPKEVIALSIFQAALGGNPRVKYSGGSGSPLGAAASSGSQYPVAINPINISYSDTGLFGFVVASAPQDIDKVVRAVVKKMRETGKGLSESQFKNAKHALKSDALQSLEPSNSLLEEVGTVSLNGGQLLTPDALVSAIDSVSLTDVNSIAAKVVKGKVSIAALGQADTVPYLEDLL